MNSGVLYALAAYLLWGLLPLYLHLLRSITTFEILAHRIAWSLVTVMILLIGLRRLDWLKEAIRQPSLIGRFVITAMLITVNWTVYIWSINSGHIIDSSLGYFINPLVNVLLGSLLLHERMRIGQKLAIAIATIAVLWLTWQAHAVPWIGLTLAVSFSLYGLLRKTAQLGAIEGFTVEAAVLTPIAIAYLLWLNANGELGFAESSWSMRLLLILAGPVTTVPLLLFAAGARRITFSMLGFLQYLAPTIQWLLGIFVFQEAFDPHKAIGFVLIWVALVIFACEGLWLRRQQS